MPRRPVHTGRKWSWVTLCVLWCLYQATSACGGVIIGTTPATCWQRKKDKELWQHYFQDYLRPCRKKIIHNATSFRSSYQQIKIEKFRFLHIFASLYRHSVWIGLNEFACSDEWNTYLSGDWNVYLFRKEPCVEQDCVDPVCEVGIYYLISTWWKNTLLIFRTAVNFNFVITRFRNNFEKILFKIECGTNPTPHSPKTGPQICSIISLPAVH